MNRKENEETVINSINNLLEGAWENPKEAKYWLDQLPEDDSDYDHAIVDYRNQLAYHIVKKNREYFELTIENLVTYYCVNFQYYNFE